MKLATQRHLASSDGEGPRDPGGAGPATAGRAPAERAGSIRDEIDLLERHHPGTRGRLLGLLPGELTRQLYDGTRGDWVSIEVSGWVCELTVQILGEDRACAHWVRGTAEHLERPVLRAFVAGVRSLFGGRPDRLVDLVPRAWSHLFRDVCDMSAEHPGAGESWLILDDIAAPVRSRPAFLLNWRSRFEGMAPIFEEGARVEWRDPPGHRRVEVRFLFGPRDEEPPPG